MDRVRADFRTGLALVGGVCACCFWSAAASARQSGDSEEAVQRIVHRFDFDERAQGNLEQEPRFWTQIALPGFPTFATGAFDFDVGHDAPPSFGLACSGRSVAFQYRGPETGVRRNTDYRIEGYIKPEGLRGARACLSAHFLDTWGHPIAGTVVRSKYIGGLEMEGGWHQVEILLPSAPANARTIGLIAWVLQESEWSTAVLGRRHIRRLDVRGKAWFDDLTVFALPRAELDATAEGNIMVPGQSQSLRVVVADYEDHSLHATLSIFAADGGLAAIHRIRASVGTKAEPYDFSMSDLNPGVYHAVLQVFSGPQEVVTRELTFARLAAARGDSGSTGRSFGIVLDPKCRSDVTAEASMMNKLSVRSAKIPVWSGVAADAPSPAERQQTDVFLQTLVRSGFSLTGVFVGPPGPIVQSDGPYPRPLMELLSGPINAWHDHMAAVVVPNAGVFDLWQIGADDESQTVEAKELDRAVEQTRTTMQQFITLPRLALPVGVSALPDGDSVQVDHHTVIIDEGVGIEAFGRIVKDARKRYPGALSVYVKPLPEAGYRRMARLARYAHRIIAARFAGASTVYVPQPWCVRDRVSGRIAEPREDYILLRTIADLLGDAAPGHRLPVVPGVVCYSFQSGDTSTLVLWDPNADHAGRTYPIQVGAATEQVDAWGVSTPLVRGEDGRHQVRLYPTPVFIEGVENWLVDLWASVRLEPNELATGTELAAHTIEIPYKGSRALSGTLALVGPESWEITGSRTSLQLSPQRVTQIPVSIRYPHNVAAGERLLTAQLQLARPPYFLEIPLTLRLGLLDVDVLAMASRKSGDIILTHTVTNRSAKMIDLRSTANVPGRERQYRPLTNVAPGDSQTVEFRFSRADALAGKTVNLSLRDVNDGPRVHNLQLIIP
ncbi:MAG: hypothetical protein ACE5E5_06045 [Phycisphaerae bacterium]